jgi:chromosome segregation ATPase
MTTDTPRTDATGTFICPHCGRDTPHFHSKEWLQESEEPYGGAVGNAYAEAAKTPEQKQIESHIEVLKRELTAANEQITAARDLLAVIHGDGGHHTEKVGFINSCKDAIIVRTALVMNLDNANEQIAARIAQARRAATHIEYWEERAEKSEADLTTAEKIILHHKEQIAALRESIARWQNSAGCIGTFCKADLLLERNAKLKVEAERNAKERDHAMQMFREGMHEFAIFDKELYEAWLKKFSDGFKAIDDALKGDKK